MRIHSLYASYIKERCRQNTPQACSGCKYFRYDPVESFNKIRITESLSTQLASIISVTKVMLFQNLSVGGITISVADVQLTDHLKIPRKLWTNLLFEINVNML